MSEKEIINHATGIDKTMLTMIGLFMVAAIGRILVSNEPFDWRKFTGEVCLAIVGAVILYSFGMLQQMDFYQMLILGGLGGLGGVRLIEQFIKLSRAIREGK